MTIFTGTLQTTLLAAAVVFSNPLWAHGNKHNDHGHGHGHGHDGQPKIECRTETISQGEAGPAAYHQAYSNIQHTNITIEDFTIRTEEGDVIHIDTDAMNVDLQALAGFAQGLNLDLTNVEFPGGAQEIHVAEIETNVKSSPQAQILSGDTTSCNLSSLPKKLNLYTAQAITLAHDAYHVKVGYSALNSIQLDLTTTVTRTVCCTQKEKSKCKGRGEDRTCSSKDETDVKQKCKLVNRRQPVNSIVRAVDDNF